MARQEPQPERLWSIDVPAVVSDLASRWHLSDFGPPLPGGSHSYVAPVLSVYGEAVLKVPLLGEANRLEADALRVYGGNGR